MVTDYSHQSISNRDFTKMELAGALFKSTQLNGSNFNGATLTGAIFVNANLKDVTFLDANLQDVDFTSAHNLVAENLAGADLSAATLPNYLLKFEVLEHAGIIASYARKIFTTILLFCGYCMWVFATTTDISLLTNSSLFQLPLIGGQIKIVVFYVVAPFVLLAFYMYFLLYLQRMWDIIATLPAYFTDGRPIDRMVDPWLITSLIRAHFRRLVTNELPLFKFQVFISKFLVWFTIPSTIFLLWLRFLTRHDFTSSFVIACTLVAVLAYGVMSYRLANMTLSGKRPAKFSAFTRKHFLFFYSLLFLSVILSVSSIFLVNPIFGSMFIVNFQEEDVSIPPDDWIGEKSQYPLVKGAKLFGAHLDHAKGYKSMLINADLRNAVLSYSEFVKANFTNARMGAGIFYRANFNGTILENVDLTEAVMRHANLDSSNMRNANLTEADLSYASLIKTSLQHVKLYGANLTGANLSGAVLDSSDLRTCILKGAILNRTKLRFTKFQKSDLSGANLRFANLHFANLDSAILLRADMRNAVLYNTRFIGANLTGSDFREASFRQTTLMNAKLDSCNFQKTKLDKTDFRGAALAHSNFSLSSLIQTDLRNANLTGADLTDAVLNGSNLSGAILTDVLGLPDSAQLRKLGVSFDPASLPLKE